MNDSKSDYDDGSITDPAGCDNLDGDLNGFGHGSTINPSRFDYLDLDLDYL